MANGADILFAIQDQTVPRCWPLPPTITRVTGSCAFRHPGPSYSAGTAPLMRLLAFALFQSFRAVQMLLQGGQSLLGIGFQSWILGVGCFLLVDRDRLEHVR